MARFVSTPLADRFWAKVDRSAGPDGCWPWLGAYNTPAKRPWLGTRRPVIHLCGSRARPPQIMAYAARVSLSLHDGVALYDRTGLEACHRIDCSNPQCVNPQHLYWGTATDNRKDRYGSPRRP